MPLLRSKFDPTEHLDELFPDLPASLFQNLKEKITNPEDNYEVIEVVESDEIINKALLNGGIPARKLNLPDPNANSFQQILHRNGASVENASKVIASVMMSGKFENSKLKAAEMVLDLHGIREADGKVKRTPNFQFIIKDSNVNIANIFAPQRSANPVSSNVTSIDD